MILIINICKEKLHYLEFVKPVEDILRNNKLDSVTKHYKELRSYDVQAANKIIICGTSLKDVEYLENAEDFGWIKTFNGKVLGICGGMQLLGLLCNAKLDKEKEIGQRKITFTKPFLNLEGEKEVYNLHNLFIKSDEFETFAETIVPQAIKHKEKPFYGTLFHPEVRNKDLILNFCKD